MPFIENVKNRSRFKKENKNALKQSSYIIGTRPQYFLIY